jgi:hypothetical protein
MRTTNSPLWPCNCLVSASIGALQFFSSVANSLTTSNFPFRVSLFSSNHILSVFLCLAIIPDLRRLRRVLPRVDLSVTVISQNSHDIHFNPYQRSYSQCQSIYSPLPQNRILVLSKLLVPSTSIPPTHRPIFPFPTLISNPPQPDSTPIES